MIMVLTYITQNVVYYRISSLFVGTMEFEFELSDPVPILEKDTASGSFFTPATYHTDMAVFPDSPVNPAVEQVQSIQKGLSTTITTPHSLLWPHLLCQTHPSPKCLPLPLVLLLLPVFLPLHLPLPLPLLLPWMKPLTHHGLQH